MNKWTGLLCLLLVVCCGRESARQDIDHSHFVKVYADILKTLFELKE